MPLRLGLCCLFVQEPIRFRTTTAKALSVMPRAAQLSKLSTLCLENARSLLLSVQTVQRLGFGAFRIASPLFPRMTHPEVGYQLEDLADGMAIGEELAKTREFASCHAIRLSFHPDQFVVLSSPNPAVVANSISELSYQAMLAEAVGADVINIHAGGVYGDRTAALTRFAAVVADLPAAVRQRLTVENDDGSYAVRDLLPLSEKTSIPLVYDVHHHRCHPDGLSIAEATRLAAATWPAGREPYCHLSSPRHGWQGGDPKPHADYIALEDFPSCWHDLTMTIDVEAKAKELAVARLQQELANSAGKNSLSSQELREK